MGVGMPELLGGKGYVLGLMISVLTLGPNFSIAYAQIQHPQPPGQNNSPSQNFDQRLKELEASLVNLRTQPAISKEQSSYLSKLDQERGQLNKLAKDLGESGEKLGDSEALFSGQYIAILALLLTILSIAVGIAVIVVQMYISYRIKIEKKRIEEHIDLHASRASILTISETYAKLALPWWENYEARFLSFLHGKIDDPKDFFQDISISRRLTETGLKAMLEAIEKAGANFINDDPNAFVTYSKLYNHWVYHRAAELICQKQRPSQVDIANLLAGSEECLKLAMNPGAGKLWFNLKQSAAFAMICYGDGPAQQIGRSELIGLLEGKRPGVAFAAPGTNWYRTIWEECFPIDPDGQRRDLYGLGNIPPPTLPT
jgi:hypothetical protein